MYLWHLAIGSEDRELFHTYYVNMTLVTWKLGQSQQNLIIPFGCPK